MFPKHARQVMADKDVRNVLDIAVKLYDQGFTKVSMVAGSDRVKEFEVLLNKYNGEKSRHGFYEFEGVIKVLSAGERDPDADGVSGMSASKMRQAAVDGSLQLFSKGLPARFYPTDLYNAVRAGMGLKSEGFRPHVELETVSDIREDYVEGKIFRIGTMVRMKESGEVGKVVIRGTNYVLAEFNGRKRRCWLDSIQEEGGAGEYGTDKARKKYQKDTPGESLEIVQSPYNQIVADNTELSFGKKKGKMSMLDRMRAAAKKVIQTNRFSWNEDLLSGGNRSHGKKIERLPDLSDEELAKRCVVLKSSTAKVVYNYIRRGLFEVDKLTVATMLQFKLLQKSGKIPTSEIQHLIIGGISTDAGAMGPVSEWMPEYLWPKVKGLEIIPCFKNIGDDMIAESDEWKKWFNDEKPEMLKLPAQYGEVNDETMLPNVTPFQKLLLLRAMRQDRLTCEIQSFISSELGPIFVEQPPFDMEQTFKETSPSTPVFFVLFPGVDPTKWVEDIGAKQGVTEDKGNFLNISMGQGQEERAELILKTFSQQGGWVFLQNVHLMPGWLTRLERTLELCAAK